MTGAPWSLQAYGERSIRWQLNQEDLRRMWAMLASLHSLHRNGQFDILGARVAQYAKAVEITANQNGSWQTSWPLTGMPEVLPKRARLEEALAHPAECAAVGSHVREQRAPEETLRKSTGTARGASAEQSEETPPWWKEEKDTKAAVAGTGGGGGGP